MSNTINAAIQIVPKTNEKGYYRLIDAAIEVIQQSGLKYEVTPMETVIEGEQNEVMQVIHAAQEATMQAGADEILVNIKLHIRKNDDVTFEEKIEKYRK